MYAADTKLYGQVPSLDDARKLQHDLDTLNKWSEEWLLKFNVAKCRVMHCGTQNPGTLYFGT